MIVLDTNVVSETLRQSPSSAVLEWLAAQKPGSVFITTVTQAETLYGVESLPPGKRRDSLATAVERIFREFEGRILPFDKEAARANAIILAARYRAGRPTSRLDAMIAAIARFRQATVATRNVADFEGCGIEIVNPWAE